MCADDVLFLSMGFQPVCLRSVCQTVVVVLLPATPTALNPIFQTLDGLPVANGPSPIGLSNKNGTGGVDVFVKDLL